MMGPALATAHTQRGWASWSQEHQPLLEGCLHSISATKVLGDENNCQLCQFMATAGPLGEAFLNPSGRTGTARNRMKGGFVEKDLMTGVG